MVLESKNYFYLFYYESKYIKELINKDIEIFEELIINNKIIEIKNVIMVIHFYILQLCILILK